ncbi:hypothetical protein JA1_003126 [Spathaspora sp. JA1]|nr:hypothetical protein JA1_003126 [Spathaspora sp. JA1]
MASVSIAIIGLHGSLGQPIIDVINSGLFNDNLKFPIKVLSRKGVESSNDKFQYIKTEINPETVDFITSALSGIDVIVELIPARPDLISTLEKVAENVKPKLYIPSQFGCDLDRITTIVPGFAPGKTEHSEKLRNFGIKTVDIVTNFFAQPNSFMYEIVQHLGVDPKEKTVVQIGPLETKVPYTTVEDIAKSVLAVATTTPIDKLPNKLKIKSDSITYREFIEKYESNNNVKLTIKETLTIEQANKKLHEKLKQSGGFVYQDLLFYLHVAGANGLEYDDKDSQLINPNESIWKWKKY